MAAFCFPVSLFALAVSNIFISGVLSSANLTIENFCDHEVWPGVSSSGSSSISTTGFALKKGESKTLTFPSPWTGNIWGRTFCVQDPSTGNFSCGTGDCGTGKLECDGRSGVSPTTLAEFSLESANGLDFYDVSLVDGFNLPMLIVPVGRESCGSAGCQVDLNGVCPAEMRVRGADDVGTVACMSACQAFGQGRYCCLGAYNSPGNCKPSSYTEFFKNRCPSAYSFPIDDENSTFSCPTGVDYLITFCPSSDSPPPDLSPGPAPSPSLPQAPGDRKEGHQDSGKKQIWIFAGVGVAVFLGVVLGLLCYLRSRKGEDERKKVKYLAALMMCGGNKSINGLGGDESKVTGLEVFSFASILTATSSFGPENKLGEGGFGPVYKGVLVNGKEVAVKRLSRGSKQGEVEFKNELVLIAKLQHVNLVRLLGCCIQGDEKMLIYEYMPNKSLDSFLFDPTHREPLNWQQRFKIIEGIAHGLLYLHKYSRLKIIHRDLKASNILLDEKMNPKISDFGMARIFKQDLLEANTNRVVGTYGYMAPEYAMEGIFSVKSDVFSFGVLMLEIVSGRKNTSFYGLDSPLNLVGYAWELWNKNAALELMDPLLKDSGIESQLLRCIHVSLLCVEDRAVDRPIMSDVISMLTNRNISLPMPKKPSFVTARRLPDLGLNKSNPEMYSVNDLSISELQGR